MSEDGDADDAAEFSYDGSVEDASPTDGSPPSGNESEITADGPGVGSTVRDPDDGVAELFEETAVEELDSDRVWAQLQAEDAGPNADVQDRTIRELDKRSYCHQCPHFSEPPAVGCDHEGTTIIELVDVRTFRVANCPVVLEEESLEER